MSEGCMELISFLHAFSIDFSRLRFWLGLLARCHESESPNSSATGQG